MCFTKSRSSNELLPKYDQDGVNNEANTDTAMQASIPETVSHPIDSVYENFNVSDGILAYIYIRVKR